ncbi:YcdB/YcdC domain-containing protein [Heliorestis convoluta]|uniref:YcdB/YcdC repeated domain-containing protein n=1 Tax=Heliorestis convoluta TaxID=356322 RepID=A0A5Q2N6H3_9FIRM|nr:YcdB/YcdC domain-containing protein [Heliorestis convoluta]QGG48972.1 hypothetical protein FTV88_2883 [Heliorestis convoluta]
MTQKGLLLTATLALASIFTIAPVTLATSEAVMQEVTTEVIEIRAENVQEFNEAFYDEMEFITPKQVELEEAIENLPQELQDPIRRQMESLKEWIPTLSEMKVDPMSRYVTESSNEEKAPIHLHLSTVQGQEKSSDFIFASLLFDGEVGALKRLTIHYPQEKFWEEIEAPSDKAKDQREQQSPVKPDPDMVFTKAKAFLEALGYNLDEYRMNDQITYSSHSMTTAEGKRYHTYYGQVRLMPLVQGIPFLSDMITLSIDQEGKINSLYHIDNFNLEKAIEADLFPEPAQAIPKEEVEKKWREDLQMNLIYLSEPFFEQDKDKIILAYTPTTSTFFNALTGKSFFEEMGIIYENYQKQEQVNLIGTNKPTIIQSAEEARNFLTHELAVDLTNLEEEPVQPLRRNEGVADGGPDFLQYHWYRQPDFQSTEEIVSYNDYVMITVCAETGRLNSFHAETFQGTTFSNSKEIVEEKSNGNAKVHEKPLLTIEEVRKKAYAFLQRQLPEGVRAMNLTIIEEISMESMLPEWVDREKIDQRLLSQPLVRFIFTVQHDGIPVQNLNYALTIHQETGQIISYHSPTQDFEALEFPSKDSIISVEEAKKMFLEDNSLELVYIWTDYFGQKAPEPQLLYMLNPMNGQRMLIDATTGKFIE